MPIFMDRHYVEGATRHSIANAHERDLEVQSKYNVQFLTYWFDEARCTAFCLVEGPSKDAIEKTHAEAHGPVPNEIIEVDPNVVQAFLGRVSDPPVAQHAGTETNIAIDSAFRAIMFTDLKDSAALTARLGDAKALHLIHIHNALTRNALRDYEGREVKHMGDGIMASFTSICQAVECAITIQKAFADYNAGQSENSLHLRIGLNAGEPVAENNDLFGTTVQLAARLCAQARPEQILASQAIFERFPNANSLFSLVGDFTPKGFAESMPVYEIHWRRV